MTKMDIMWILANNVNYGNILSIIGQYVTHVTDNTIDFWGENMSIMASFLLFWEKMFLKLMLIRLIRFLSIADCNNTFYGINCTQKCNKRCVNGNCHHTTGDCIDDKQVCYLVLVYIDTWCYKVFTIKHWKIIWNEN